MESATRSNVRAIAGQLAIIVGVVHLGLGMFYTVGPGAVARDLRVVVWAVAGAVLVGGVALATFGWQHRRLYEIGAAVVGLLVAGHLFWPVFAQGSLYVGPGPSVTLADPLGYVYAQLFEARTIAKVLLVLELLLLSLPVVLLSDDGLR